MSAQLSPTKVHTEVKTRVFHNAEERDITFQVGSTVEQCDQLAAQTFAIVNNPHTYGLYRKDGVTELLPVTALIQRVTGHEQPAPGHVGIQEGEKLLLRPSTVRGG